VAAVRPLPLDQAGGEVGEEGRSRVCGHGSPLSRIGAHDGVGWNSVSGSCPR
jgi:hypothetical protein